MTCRTELFHDCLAMDLESKGVRSWLGRDYLREDGSGINLDDTEWDFKNYDALFSVFSGRKLTHEADALNGVEARSTDSVRQRALNSVSDFQCTTSFEP